MAKGPYDDIIKAILGKLDPKSAAKKIDKKITKTPRKSPPSPQKRKTTGKPPAVGSKGTGRPSTRGGMTSKELDAYRSKTYSDSRNYFENSAKYQKDIKAATKKNQLKKRGEYK